MTKYQKCYLDTIKKYKKYVSDLTKKLKSIQAFKAVKVPLKKLDGNKEYRRFAQLL